MSSLISYYDGLVHSPQLGYPEPARLISRIPCFCAPSHDIILQRRFCSLITIRLYQIYIRLPNPPNNYFDRTSAWLQLEQLQTSGRHHEIALAVHNENIYT